jgi:hypothetical protein
MIESLLVVATCQAKGMSLNLKQSRMNLFRMKYHLRILAPFNQYMNACDIRCHWLSDIQLLLDSLLRGSPSPGENGEDSSDGVYIPCRSPFVDCPARSFIASIDAAEIRCIFEMFLNPIDQCTFAG